MAAPTTERKLVDIIESFNRSLKYVTIDLVSKFPDDAMIYRAKTRIMTVISIDPVFVIKAVGPFLYKYRDEIAQLEQESPGGKIEKFFLDNTFSDDFTGSTNNEKIELVQYIMPKAKLCARNMNETDRREYKKLVVALLDDYVDYLWITTSE
jgi:hypothetical protein